MSRGRIQDRTNSQFYRKLRLDKEIMAVISHFRKIKKYMMQEREFRRIETKETD